VPFFVLAIMLVLAVVAVQFVVFYLDAGEAVARALAARPQRHEDNAHAGDETDDEREERPGERPNDNAGELSGEQHHRQKPRQQSPHEVLTPFPARPARRTRSLRDLLEGSLRGERKVTATHR
jgi:hypothetical protein